MNLFTITAPGPGGGRGILIPLRKKTLAIAWTFVVCFLNVSEVAAQRPMEFLDRGLIALEKSDGVYLSWRMLGTDPDSIGFNLYRNGEKINTEPITESTNYEDSEGTVEDVYKVETLHSGGPEQSGEVEVWSLKPAYRNPGRPSLPHKKIPLPAPPVVDTISYIPGDMSVGDLDGDGKYELVFEWEPDGVSINSFLEAIDLEGNSLWRIECGPNTTKNKLNIMVYDLDMDGKAEVALKTGPGTKDGTGTYLSTGPAGSDDDSYIIPRPSGRMMGGPTYLTVFNGASGAEMATVDYFPQIGDSNDWGDDYGHRASSLKTAVLYDQALGPILVSTRGIYEKIAMGAYTWDGMNLNQVWTFDTNDPGNEDYAGQGNHSVGVGDVDGDGSDELMYGAMAIDNDGTGLYTTGRGHGDSHHLTDHMPDRPGLEYFQGHENDTYGISMRDAGTGEIIWEVLSSSDVGRAWAADADPGYRGSEVVAIGFPNYDAQGNEIPTNYNAYNQPVYFDGDVQRERRGGANVNGDSRIFTGWYYGASTIHGSKNDANLVADILGDWREEIILRNGNNEELLVFSTWIPTERKNPTLMHDPLYRMNIVVQSIGYNQPAHTGYYFADGYPEHDIYMVGVKDCNGVVDGTAYMDECGTCVGGDTGLQPCMTLTMESEASCYKSAMFDDRFEGYSDQGYLIMDKKTNGKIASSINTSMSQEVEVTIRYANGSGQYLSSDLIMNNSTRQLSYTPAASWEDWQELHLTLTLEEGENILEIKKMDGLGRANIDFIQITGVDLEATDCKKIKLAEAEEDFVVYPNPATDYFSIKGFKSYHYIIYDLNQNIHEDGEGNQNSKLGEQLSPGEYLITLEVEGENYSRRIRKE
ncbi:hypothetical protein FKX85_07855 [Echinicola soli]|uniref:Uncharacterized protein n=1 Tax=Echinicola soli TaxID=2591634 RepID=A0A514CH00_9BACT|nr:hypothetical protein [Echinicola soli]QDH78954.1 hypothetical protein FKX85_07855 [Echinicola soli]